MTPLSFAHRANPHTDDASAIALRDQQTRQQADARLRLVGAFLGDLVWECDAARRLSFLSLPEQTSAKQAEATFLGRPISRLLRPIPGIESALPQLKQAVRNRQTFEGLRLLVACSPHDYRAMQVKGWPVWDDSGAFAGYRGNAVYLSDADLAQAEQLRLARHWQQAIIAAGFAVLILDADEKLVLHSPAVAELVPLLGSQLCPGTDYGMLMKAVVARGASLVDGDEDALVMNDPTVVPPAVISDFMLPDGQVISVQAFDGENGQKVVTWQQV